MAGVDFDSLYTGLAFPLTKKPQGYLTRSGSSDVIKSSLRMILFTIPGERVCLPEFGSKLWFLVGEPNDQLLHQLANAYTVEAVRRWENRVKIIRVEARAQDNSYHLSIQYFNKTTGQPDQLELEFIPRGVSG